MTTRDLMLEGLAIAAGGTVIITLLGDTWPTWVQVPLAAVFLLVGLFFRNPIIPALVVLARLPMKAW